MKKITVRPLKNIFAASLGLLGKNEPSPILFKTHWGIHTFFMQFPIDVLILDSENRVVKIKQNLVPFRLFFWNPRYNVVIELPSGSIKRLKIKSGEELRVCFESMVCSEKLPV